MRAFLLLLLTLAAAPVAAEERITRFASEVRVEPDASLTVAEEITVIAEGREIRHGILRDFPTTYTDRYGGRVRVGFELLTVERDGRPEPHLLEPLENGRRIRIGSAELRLPPG